MHRGEGAPESAVGTGQPLSALEGVLTHEGGADPLGDHLFDGLDRPELHDDLDLGLAFRQCVIDQAADGGTGFEQDDWLAVEIPHLVRAVFVERVPGRHNQPQLVVDPWGHGETGGRIHGKRNDAEVEGTREDGVDDGLASLFSHLDLDAGMSLVKHPEERW